MTTGTNYKTIDDKGYFSAYANQALHNVFVTLSDINRKCVGRNSIGNDTQLLRMGVFDALKHGQVGDYKLPLNDLALLLDKLQYHFPFLRILYNADDYRRGKNKNDFKAENHLEQTCHILEELLGMLISYRNYLTHEYGGTPQFNENVINHLRNIFDANKEAIKERYDYTSDELKHLVRYDRSKETYPNNNLRKDIASFQYSFYEEGKALSEKGVVFLICLFLRPKDAFLFIKKIKGFKDSRTRNFKATIHCYTSYGIKLPHENFVSNTSEEGLLLDIIGELTKVPGAVFNVLSRENQEKFRPELKTIEDAAAEDTEIDNIEYLSEVFLKRHRDRFGELALEYLDKNRAFSNLRFAINYGRFYYRVDEKKVVNESINRWLTKDLIGFFTKEEIKEWKGKSEVKELLIKSHNLEKGHSTPHILDRFPEYIIQSNRLLASFEKGDFPELIKDKSDPCNFKEPKSFNLENSFYISVHDFHVFIFYALLVDDGNKVSGEIKRWIEAFKRLKEDLFKPELTQLIPGDIIENERSEVNSNSQTLTEFVTVYNERKGKVNEYLSKEYRLTVDEIPKTWRNHLLKIKEPDSINRKKAALQRLIAEHKSLIEDFEKQVKHFKESEDRTRKRIQSGKISDILARDMVTMMDIEPEGKPNSSEYRELQKTMAFWGRYKDRLEPMFITLKISTSIPFWEKIRFNPESGIYTFMKSYFHAKIDYLRTLDPSRELYFLKIEMRKLSEDSLKASLKKDMYPYALPRGFFDNMCIEALRKQGQTFPDGYKINRIINNCFPKSQPFYDYPRIYEIFNRWHDDRSAKQKYKPMPQKELSESERAATVAQIKEWIDRGDSAPNPSMSKLSPDKVNKLLKFFYKNEQNGRWTQVKDKLLFELALKIINAKSELFGWEGLALEILGSDTQDSIFNETISYTMKYEPKKTGKVYSITDSEMKMKDFGKFRKLLSDRRLPGLLDLWGRSDLQRQDIIDELDAYQDQRIAVISEIIAFEKRMIELYPDYFNELKAKDDNGVVQHRLFLEYLEKEGKINNDTYILLSTIRNKLCHNEYPTTEEIEGLSLDTDEFIITQICTFAFTQYSKLGHQK